MPRYGFTAKVALVLPDEDAHDDGANALCERVKQVLLAAGIEIAPGSWVYREPDFTMLDEDHVLDAHDLIRQYAPSTGWDTLTLLILAIGFINAQDSAEVFLKHLEACAREEEGENW